MKKIKPFLETFGESDNRLNCSETWSLPYPEVHTFELCPDLVKRGENSSFSLEEVDHFCKQAQPGMLINRELADRITDDKRFLIESVDYQPVEEWGVGREDSIHGVKFGQLAFRRTDGIQREYDVAMKTFYSWKSGVANELAALIKIPDITGVDGFEPIGIISGDGQEFTLITMFEPNVVSLDNEDWHQSIRQPVEESLDINEALQKSAFTLASMHRAGFIHNDAEIKNMAVDISSQPSRVRLIDLESAKWRNLYDSNQPKDEFDPAEQRRFLDGVYNDASALVSSILKRGLWGDAGFDSKEHAIRVWFTEPYLSYLRHPSNQYGGFTPELFQEVSDRVDAAIEGV